MDKKKEKQEKKNNSYKIIYSFLIIAILVTGYLVFNSGSKKGTEETNNEASLDIEELFNCEGKNTFTSDCWKKIQFIDKQIVYNIAAGSSLDIEFAFMNRLEVPGTFSYSITALRAADLVKEGCPMPSQADSYLTSQVSKQDIVLDVSEISKERVSLKAPQINTPTSGCPYRYVLDVKESGKFYEKTYFDIVIKS